MPIPVTYETPEFAANESLKGFADTDSLAKGYLELQGRVAGGSLDLLPEEMRKDPALTVFKTLPDLAKGYLDTKKMVGTIKKAPETADGYKFTPMANLNANLKPDSVLSEFKGVFHKAGLPNESADIVQQEVLTILSNRMTQAETAKKDLALKNETALKGEWGADYDKKFDMVLKTLVRAGGPDAIAATDQVSKALGGSPVLLKALGKVFSLLSEDSIGSLGEPADKEITGSKEALDEITKMNAEILAQGGKHPFYDEKHADHKATKEKMDKLFKTAYPNAQ